MVTIELSDKYIRTIQELEKLGAKWWPKEVKEEALKKSILQYLLDTQDSFISILTLADAKNVNKLFALLDAANYNYQLFLKHLMILTDMGSEPLQRLNASFNELFPDGRIVCKIGNVKLDYKFKSLPTKGKPSNDKLQIDTIENLKKECKNKELCKDIAILLIYGGCAESAKIKAILSKCNVYELLGTKDKIKHFVQQNYIRVSRIVSGRVSNDLGNVAQSYVVNFLKEKLGGDYTVTSNATIPGVTLDDNKEATFDIVVERENYNGKFKPYVGVEVSFQETSNSTVERKGREARARFQNTIARRSYVAYIIDGAGNFSRTSAANDMCMNSHCNVAYTYDELMVLVEFIKEKLR